MSRTPGRAWLAASILAGVLLVGAIVTATLLEPHTRNRRARNNRRIDHPGGLTRAHVTLASAGAEDAKEVLVAALVNNGVGVRRIVEDDGELEQIFLGLTKEAS